MQELPITDLSKGPWPNQWLEKTLVMGVINITPDSFSDGGLFLDAEKALQQAQSHLEAGADVLDIGAQSTRPGASSISTEEELNRLIPALKAIRRSFPKVIISVDTFLSGVAEAALKEGADWINDVSGGSHDVNILSVISDAQCPYVIMHSRGNSKTMNQLANYKDIYKELYNELLIKTETAIQKGVSSSQIIWDPGLGFAKNTEHNLIILRRLKDLCKSKFPILVGPSRKRFIGDVLKEPNMNERIWGTSAVVCKCVETKVALVRVHDVGPIYKTISMANKLWL